MSLNLYKSSIGYFVVVPSGFGLSANLGGGAGISFKFVKSLKSRVFNCSANSYLLSLWVIAVIKYWKSSFSSTLTTLNFWVSIFSALVPLKVSKIQIELRLGAIVWVVGI